MRRKLSAISILLLITACNTAHMPTPLARAAMPDAVSVVADPGHTTPPSAAMFVGPQGPTRLPEPDRLALTRWEHALVKRCDARDALGITVAGPDEGDVDLGILRAQMQQDNNNDIPTLTTSQERVVFGNPHLVQASSATAWNVAGARITAVSEHGTCTLSIDDVVIHRALLATQVPIEARLLTAPGSPTVIERAYVPHIIGRSYVGVRSHGLWDAMQSAVRPDKATTQHVAERLGLTRAMAHRLFVRQYNLSLAAAMQVLHGNNIPWFSPATPDVMGTSEDIATLFEREDLRTRLQLVMRASPWPTVQTPRTPQAAWLTLEATVQVRPPHGPSRASVPASTEVCLQALRIAPPTWVGPYTGTRCLQDRAAILLGGRANTASSTVMPTFASIAEPCAVFEDGLRPQGYTDGVFMDLLPQVLRHVLAGPRVDYKGWDTVLLRVAADLQRNQQDIAQSLDPHGQAPVIDRLGDSLSMLQGALVAYPNLQNERAAMVHMVGGQALRGNVASPTCLNAMLATLDGAFAAFPDASRLWIDQLEHRNMLQDTTFATAQQMTPAYVAEAHEAADVAARYHDTDFLDHVYHAILQTHPSMHILQTYIDTTRRRHARERY